ncbi:MAG: adenosine kinase [Bdellovibrionota bacterium]
MARRYDVYGVGNAIMDLQLRVEEEDLKKLQLVKGGMKLVEPEEQKSLLEYYHGRDLNRASGGSAANTMIAIAQLGGFVAYGCAVGNDDYGNFYFEEMDELAVQLHTLPIEGKPTGTCVILITPDAERTMNTHLGASVELEAEHVSEEMLGDSEWVYIEGYLFSQPSGQRVIRRVCELTKKHGVKVAVTFSDGFIVEYFREPLDEALKYADLVFANLNEARKYTGLTDPDEVFEKYASAFPTAVMTMSEKGARVRHLGLDYDIPPFPVKAVDDTGAGDMFAGGFLYGLTQGMDAEHAGRLACYLASKVVSQLGPRLHCDVKELLLKKEYMNVGRLSHD